MVDEAGLAKLPLVEPVYPLTEGSSLNQVRKAVDAALPKLPELPEWQDPPWVSRERYPSFADALKTLHRPASPDDVLPESRAWTRLAYDELLAGQLALALVRAHLRRPAGRATPGTGALRKKLIDALPYSLTASQIARDRAKSPPTSPSPSGCCGCCRATSAPARPSWRCLPPRPSSKPAGRRR